MFGRVRVDRRFVQTLFTASDGCAKREMTTLPRNNNRFRTHVTTDNGLRLWS